MKKFILIYVLIMMGCSEKKSVSRVAAVDEDVHAEYDTVPIDSFSPGATSATVVARLRQPAIRSADSAASLQKHKEETGNKADAAKSVSSNQTPQQNP